MKLKWHCKKLNRAKGPLICLHPKAKEPVMFKKVGDVVDMPDEVAYDLLKKYPDILMKVKTPARASDTKVEKAPPKPKKKAPPKNKMMTTEMLKDK